MKGKKLFKIVVLLLTVFTFIQCINPTFAQESQTSLIEDWGSSSNRNDSVHIIIGWYEQPGTTPTRPDYLDVEVHWTETNGYTHSSTVRFAPKGNASIGTAEKNLGIYQQGDEKVLANGNIKIDRWKSYPQTSVESLTKKSVTYVFPDVPGYIKQLDGDCGVIYIKVKEDINENGNLKIYKTTTVNQTGDNSITTPNDATFTITNFNTGEVVETVKYSQFINTETINNVVYKYYELNNIPLGTYKVTESKAEIPGYALKVEGSKVGYNNIDKKGDNQEYQINSGPEATANLNNSNKSDNAYLENIYTNAKASVNLNVKKMITGGTLQGGEFKFEIRDGNALVGTATNDASGNIKFPTISYNSAGKYRYTIKEIKGNMPNVTYDTTLQTITVTVTEENGEYKVSADKNQITFNNVYSPSSTSTSLELKKILTGRDWLEDDSFEFNISGYDDKTKEAINNGNVVIPESLIIDSNNQVLPFDITFNKAGDYSFVVREVKGNIKDITYSDKEVVVKYKVSDYVSDGTLKATLISNDDLTFTNEYKEVKPIIKENEDDESIKEDNISNKDNNKVKTGDNSIIGIYVVSLLLSLTILLKKFIKA